MIHAWLTLQSKLIEYYAQPPQLWKYADSPDDNISLPKLWHEAPSA